MARLLGNRASKPMTVPNKPEHRAQPSGGTLELSYGRRTFTARLLPDLRIELFNPEGRKLASLPEPRQDDDADLAQQAKKSLSAAKRELKGIVQLQTGRLYEAMCSERRWSTADWVTWLQQHPILRPLVQRLTWVERVDGQPARAFRPLDDTSLMDHEDRAVVLSDEGRIQLAHDSLLDTATLALWQQHLIDYEVQPLFQQIGRGHYDLPAAHGDDKEVNDFEGHLIETFALRGRALKLGDSRGSTEGNGRFDVYEKRFRTLGLQAYIYFPGDRLPERNRTVALLGLSVLANVDASGRQQASVTLARVPEVLLSECYNDLRVIAADGSGYDADWGKKCNY